MNCTRCVNGKCPDISASWVYELRQLWCKLLLHLYFQRVMTKVVAGVGFISPQPANVCLGQNLPLTSWSTPNKTLAWAKRFVTSWRA